MCIRDRVLGVISALDLGSMVGVLRDCAWFTPGRIATAQQDLFIYGWGFNAFFALNLWLLAQLGRFEFRNGWLAQLGGVAWNLALTYGIARVFAGDMTGYRLLDFPREVGPVLAVAFLPVSYTHLTLPTKRIV